MTRSTKRLYGAKLVAGEQVVGHVTVFMMDDENWAVTHLVVETGHRFTGKEIVISPGHVTQISYDDSKVFVNLTREAIQQSPEFYIPTINWTGHDS